MLRPKSAMYYIKDLEEISNEFLNLVVESQDENKEVADLLELVNIWALESIVVIFLNVRLNCLNLNLSDASDAKVSCNL